jgi:hypothetical protein
VANARRNASPLRLLFRFAHGNRYYTISPILAGKKAFASGLEQHENAHPSNNPGRALLFRVAHASTNWRHI